MHQPHCTEYSALLQAFKNGDPSKYVNTLLRMAHDGLPVHDWIVQDKLARDWSAYTSWALDAKKEDAQGFIFLVAHGGNPEWLKLGKTKFAPHTRLKQLTVEIGTPIHLLKAWPVFDKIFFYRLIDEHLSRVPRDGLFYRSSASDLVSRIDTCLNQEYSRLRALNQFALIVPPSDTPRKPDFFTGI